MSAIDSLKIGIQSLIANVEALTQNINTVSNTVVGSATNIDSKIQYASNSMMGASMRMNSAITPRMQSGFTNTGALDQYVDTMPLNTQKKDDIISQLYNWNFANEYNKPSNWFRDILAIGGHQFVDMPDAEAKRLASRNWERRWKTMGWNALNISTLGATSLLNPWTKESTVRKYEYMDFMERTGYRNVDARMSEGKRSEWGSEKEIEVMSEFMAGAWKGSGFKKSQYDEFIQELERVGGLKRYDKMTISQYKQKIKDAQANAKRIMQTLNVSVTDAAAILGDINTMNTKIPTSRFISKINMASAQSGMSPMQLRQFALGRSEMYRGMGYAQDKGYLASLDDISNIANRTNVGSKPYYERIIGTVDQLAQSAINNPAINQMMGAFVQEGSGGKISLDAASLKKFVEGGISMTALPGMAVKNASVASSDYKMLSASGSFFPLMVNQGGLDPNQMNNVMARMAVGNEFMHLFPETPITVLKDRDAGPEYMAALASSLNVSMELLDKVLNTGGIFDLENAPVAPYRITRNIGGKYINYVGDVKVNTADIRVDRWKGLAKEKIARKYNIDEIIEESRDARPFNKQETTDLLRNYKAIENEKRVMRKISHLLMEGRYGDAKRLIRTFEDHNKIKLSDLPDKDVLTSAFTNSIEYITPGIAAPTKAIESFVGRYRDDILTSIRAEMRGAGATQRERDIYRNTGMAFYNLTGTNNSINIGNKDAFSDLIAEIAKQINSLPGLKDEVEGGETIREKLASSKINTNDALVMMKTNIEACKQRAERMLNG